MGGWIKLINEQCCNPIKPDCNNRDIVVYIQIASERLPVCRQCWENLAETNIEWGQEGLKEIT